MDEPALVPIGGGQAAYFSARAPDIERPNEDAAALLPVDAGSCVLAVADGLGGAQGGARASEAAVRRLAEALAPGVREGGMLRTAILNGFEAANGAIRELSLGAGTTLAVAEVQEDVVRPYHAGDSTILVVGQQGKVKLQTVDHSPVGFAVEAGLLDEEAALHHEDRHIISNFVGGENLRIEMGTALHLSPRDTLCLASDGLGRQPPHRRDRRVHPRRLAGRGRRRPGLRRPPAHAGPRPQVPLQARRPDLRPLPPRLEREKRASD